MECIRGKTSAEIGVDRLAADVAGYDDVLIDVGTGDGRYVLHVARTSPTWFALGVDACRDNLRKASRKAPPNALYLIANALALPKEEIGGMASKVTINFPWGSLLTELRARGVLRSSLSSRGGWRRGDLDLLRGLFPLAVLFVVERHPVEKPQLQ